MAVLFGADELWQAPTDTRETEGVILVGVRKTGDRAASEADFRHELDELAELARACYMEPVCFVTQQLPRVDQAMYVRQGKAAEIAELVEKLEAGRVIFNDTLSPSQLRNLQKLLKVPIMDRTRLILEIFERRARTREAKLQVELARLQYLKPRLIGYWETQNRQGGTSGSMSSRGEGEKQLEIDRRTIDHRLSELRRELALVSRERTTQRKKRASSGLPLVALVGYTNAGKSTIMNAMLRHWGTADAAGAKNVFEADMLFATLDTSIRRIDAGRGRSFLLSDTVGFINALPTALVEAFHSTLEEVTQADLLLQVVDGSDPHHTDHMRTTQETINDLGAGHIPMLTVFNKSDLRDPSIVYPRRGMKQTTGGEDTNENVYISARDSESIAFLTEVILEKLATSDVSREYLIPYDRGDVLSFLTAHAKISFTDYREDGTFLQLSCPPAIAGQADKMLVKPPAALH